MTVPARLSLVTLGVADLDRSVAFYETLGWEKASSSIDGVIQRFKTADTNLGLFPYQDLPHRRGRPAHDPVAPALATPVRILWG